MLHYVVIEMSCDSYNNNKKLNPSFMVIVNFCEMISIHCLKIQGKIFGDLGMGEGGGGL